MKLARPSIRLPVQVGTTSFWSLARTAVLFLPSVILLCIAVPAGAVAVWEVPDKVVFAIVATIIGAIFLVVVSSLKHLRIALRERPSDAVLLPEGILRIEGGPHSGRSFDLSTALTCTVEHVTKKRTRYFGADEAIAIAQLRIDGEVLAEAVRPIERESLTALRDTIHAQEEARGALLPAATKEKTTEHADLVTCPSCRAALVPEDAPSVSCRYCGAQAAIPEALRERIRALAVVQSHRPKNERRVLRLLDQPGAERANAIMALLGVPILAVWPAAAAIGWALHKRELLGFVNVSYVLLAAGTALVALFFLLRASLVNRQALALVSLEFGARAPTHPNEPYQCRQCSAPLPDPPDQVLVHCRYCDAENILGLDVRHQAGRETRQGLTLEAELRRRSRERVLWTTLAVLSVGMLAVDRMLVRSAFRPHSKRAVAEARCSAGDGASCAEAAAIWKGNTDAPHHLEHTAALYAKSCDHGDKQGCADGAVLYEDELKDDARAVPLYEKACQGGVLSACNSAGWHYQNGTGVDKNDPLAVDRYRRACDGGDAKGCNNLGFLHAHGRAGEKDERQATALYEKACKLGSLLGCSNVAWMYEHGAGVTRDLARADAEYSRACAGDADRCGETADFRQRRCVAGDVAQCQRLATLFLDDGKSATDERKEDAYKAACSHGSGDGCFGLGLLADRFGLRFRDGTLKSSKAKRALSSYEKACNLGSARGCNNLGLLYAHGDGVTANAERARKLYDQACKGGSKLGCNNAVALQKHP